MQKACKCNSKVQKLSTSNLVSSSRELRSAMLNASCETEELHANCYVTFQAVASSTNEHHNDAAGHVCVAGVHQWIGICEHKISGSKHIDGSSAWGFVALQVQLPPTWLARGDVVVLRAGK